MPPLTSATADDWLKLTLTWRWLNMARVSPNRGICVHGSILLVAALWLVGLWDALHAPQTSLMRKPGSPITPHPTLRPPVFPPSLPFLGPNGLGDGLYFAPQKLVVFFSTAGYSICKGLASEVLWISITLELPLVSMFLPLRGGAVVSNG